MESWRSLSVEGFEHYEVSDQGRVRGPRGIRKTKLDPQNYVQVVLCKDGEQLHKRVHRLVAVAFLSNPHNLPHVNHIDFNKANNAAANLEWCTAKHNENEKIEHLREIGKYKRPHAKLTKEKIAEAKTMRAQGMLLREIAAVFDVSRACIGYALNGDTYRGNHP
jgi:hypothetical protein